MPSTLFQRDITGGLTELSPASAKKGKPEKVHSSTTGYRNITIRDGLDEKDAESSSMLIHRVLQRKVVYGGLGPKDRQSLFLKIMKNEMMIKTGEIDAVSASRDSLIMSELLKK